MVSLASEADVASSTGSRVYWYVLLPKSLCHSFDAKSGRVRSVEDTVANQSSKTMWNWGVMDPVLMLRTRGTELECLVEIPI